MYRISTHFSCWEGVAREISTSKNNVFIANTIRNRRRRDNNEINASISLFSAKIYLKNNPKFITEMTTLCIKNNTSNRRGWVRGRDNIAMDKVTSCPLIFFATITGLRRKRKLRYPKGCFFNLRLR